ncbi:MAG: tetratricopeptide repeat protein [Syntrophaceae bacterium]|nr:tetratricopeptide repeat protein [Syntrophaceae bacterium]
MSLIIDALKKAQQLRFKERQETSSPAQPGTGNKGRRRSGGRWMVAGIGILSFLVFAILCWRSLSSPPYVPLPQPVRVVKKPPVSIPEKKPEEMPKEIHISPEEILSSLKDTPSSPKDTLIPKKNVVSYGSIEKPKPVAALQKTVLALPKGGLEKPAPALPSLKEKPPSKSLEVKRDDDRQHRLVSEILNHFNLGVQFQNRREFSKAIEAYQNVLRLDPTYVEAHNNLGMIYQETGDLDKAFEAYQKSVKINPGYEKGHNNLGVLLYLMGRHEEALESFQKALAINSNNIESHINLGVLFKKKGELAKAIECYQRALNIDPSHREIHYNVALLYEQLGDIEFAIGHYQQFIKLASQSHPELVSKVQRHLDYLWKIKGEGKSKPR